MTPINSIRKNLLITCFMFVLSAGAFAATPNFSISDKLLQAFKQTFPDAQQVKWAEQEDKYMVNFKQGEILTKIEYDKEGNFLSSLRYYTEKNLPVSILCRLQKKYGDKKVFGVTEMTTDASVEYYIKLEDENNFITVRSNADGNMQVVEKYKKAS
ncbi:MAG: PepSY-like domain-containing protein [Bacteroidetes bacterium]|nr:PepSY-like domain-containing protein [Bacteroidota bacterium]